MFDRVRRLRRPLLFGAVSVACFTAAVIVLATRGGGHSSKGPGDRPNVQAVLPLRHVPRTAGRSPSGRSHRVLKAIWAPLRMPDGSSVVPQLHSLGVDVLQVQVQWSKTARTRPRDPTDPNDPAYTWPPELASTAAQAGKSGIQMAIMVKDAPSWANGGRASQWAPSRDADYADFLTAAARRYPAVRRWMIWGEVNRGQDFQPMPPNSPTGPRRYATLLAAAYKALKATDPRNIVIGGMTFTYGVVRPPDFLRWMRLPSGALPPLDEWGHNPYSRRRPELNAPVSYPGARDMGDMPLFATEVHNAYRASPLFRKSGPQLWLSEFTVSSDRPNRAFSFATSREDQARWLSSAFDVAMRTDGVVGLGWFNLLDDPRSQPQGLTTGLLTDSGTPKPAYSAYRRVP